MKKEHKEYLRNALHFNPVKKGIDKDMEIYRISAAMLGQYLSSGYTVLKE